MARTIMVERDGAVASFTFNKIDRSKLYGSRRRVPLDATGEACSTAGLTDDGSMLIRAGMTAQGYFAEDGEWLAIGDLVGLDPSGEPLDKRPSTLGRAVELEGPLPVQELLDVRVQTVYRLEPEAIEDGGTRESSTRGSSAVLEQLAKGEVFRFPFSYRPDFKEGSAWLVANVDGEIFALIGEPTVPFWCEPHQVLSEFEDEDFDDELDFEMF